MTKILIADDDAGQRRLVELTLPAGDFEVLQAGDGHEALEMARLHRPAIVFLDWQMPGPSGIEVCRALREAGSDEMYIVIVSGRAEDADVRAGLAAGADYYLVKPFSAHQIHDTVTVALGLAPRD